MVISRFKFSFAKDDYLREAEASWNKAQQIACWLIFWIWSATPVVSMADVTLADKDDYSMLANDLTMAILVISKDKLAQDFEAEVCLRFWSWITVEVFEVEADRVFYSCYYRTQIQGRGEICQ